MNSKLRPKADRLTLMAGLFLGLVPANLAFTQDRVYPKQGVVVSGEIQELSAKEVTLEVRGKNQTFEMSEVRKVTFDDEPTGLDRARESYLNDQFDQALDEIKKIDASSLKSPRVREDYQFYRWFCEGKLSLAGEGDKNAAIQGLLALASGNRNTHHLYALSEMLGALALSVNKPDNAANYYKVLLSAPDPNLRALGIYRLAEVELSQQKVDQAKERLGQLVKAQSKSPEMTRLKSLAAVGLAVCENLAGNSQEALGRLDELIAKHDSTDHELFARIYNAQGAVYQSLNQPQEALLSYLKTDLLFFSHADPHAEALFHLKTLWSQVGESARAAEAGSRLVAQYASSAWANKP